MQWLAAQPVSLKQLALGSVGDLPESHKVGDVINKMSCLNPDLHKALIVCAHLPVTQREKGRGRKGKEGGREEVRGERERKGGREGERVTLYRAVLSSSYIYCTYQVNRNLCEILHVLS